MSDLPYSVSQSTVRIMGVDVVVHQLNTGQRIIEADSMAALFEAMETGETIDGGEAETLAKALRTTPQETGE